MLNKFLNNILWMPIDIPKFPIQNFYIAPEQNWKFWDYKKLTVETNNPYSFSCLSDQIKKSFPLLDRWINLFPFVNIVNIKVNIQKQIVLPHIDFTNPNLKPDLFKNNQINDPCGYRVLIRGERDLKLYVMKDNKKIFVNLPNETDVYVLGQTNCLHGVEEDIGRTTLYLQFFIDENKQKDLLEKSWKKYKKYAILR